jgi:hypothetical protein
MNPGLVSTATVTQFGNDHEAVRIRMECLLDKLIGLRTVLVAGVDMVHAGLNCLAQNSDSGIDVTRWSPDAGSGKLHGYRNPSCLPASMCQPE